MTDSEQDLVDSDEVLHHITAADVAKLLGRPANADDVELIKDRLAQSLTDAVNDILGAATDELTSADELAFERRIMREGR